MGDGMLKKYAFLRTFFSCFVALTSLMLTLVCTLTTRSLADSYSFGEEAARSSGGFLDPLLAGTGVGVLFGYPFTDIGLIDVIVAALGLYLLLKLVLIIGLSDSKTIILDKTHLPDEDDPKKEVKMRALSAWARLRSESNEQDAYAEPSHTSSSMSSQKLPQDFDHEDFLDGAKLLYTRLQKAWAHRDIGQLEAFITPDMLAVLTEHAKEHPEKNEVDVVWVTSSLISVEENDTNGLQAKVLFNALIQEKEANHPFETKEIWYFVFDSTNQTTWQLDGIEPIEKTE